MEMWCDGGNVPLDEARLRFEVNIFGLAEPRPARHVANAAVAEGICHSGRLRSQGVLSIGAGDITATMRITD
jgi:hypothetical protein